MADEESEESRADGRQRQGPYSGTRRQLHSVGALVREGHFDNGQPSSEQQQQHPPQAQDPTSGHRPPEEAQSHSELKDMVDSELGKYMNPTIAKDIKKETEKLVDKIRAMQKTKTRTSTIEKEIEELKQGRLPHSAKQLGISFQSHLLEEMASQEGVDCTIDTQASTRENKEKLHLQYLLHQRQLDIQLLKMHRQELKQFLKVDNFIARCLKDFGGGPSNPSDSLHLLGIADSDDEMNGPTSINTFGQSIESITAKVVAIYKKVVDKEAARVLNISKEEKSKADEAKKFIEAVIKKSPEEHLLDTVDRRLKDLIGGIKLGKEQKQELLKKVGKGSSSGEAKAAVTALRNDLEESQLEEKLRESAIEMYEQSAPKDKGKGYDNLRSGIAPSSNRRSRGRGGSKGKEKGRGRSLGKGKGPGRSQGDNKGKGQRKGKAKSKSPNTGGSKNDPEWTPKSLNISKGKGKRGSKSQGQGKPLSAKGKGGKGWWSGK
eukprot:TRINITY_DN81174_c0_g1_i1.p1 TRINITY_DN81174_c0_g1~~TRINITY_DN81174_c0_g1_i1.p1  ORF type:complete len:490 (+),score=116.36 TRINITY_DN81174_c0_g1_i1:1486-2955(+)